MNRTTRTKYALLLGLVLAATGATECFAWSKNFNGTRDQVRAACGGMELREFNNATSCYNSKNGNAVVCNDSGRCTGTGDGPSPARTSSGSAGPGQVILGPVGGKSMGSEARSSHSEGSTTDGGSVLAGDGSGGEGDAGGGSGHIGNGNGTEAPQWHSSR